jgi:hypothetical protein
MLSKIEHPPLAQLRYKTGMAEHDLSLYLTCPRCGAAPLKMCMLSTGVPRVSSHVERWDIAKNVYQNRPIGRSRFDKELVEQRPRVYWPLSG